MKEKFTTQDVIDMASELYDKKGFSRLQISAFLGTLLYNDMAEFDFDRIYDLIVG